MMLGFGRIELEAAKQIINECIEKCKETGSPKSAIRDISKQYRSKSDINDELSKAESPERYTYFFHNVFDVTDRFWIAEFEMFHINRRHAMSPDGWALLRTKWVLTSCNEEFTIYKEA